MSRFFRFCNRTIAGMQNTNANFSFNIFSCVVKYYAFEYCYKLIILHHAQKSWSASDGEFELELKEFDFDISIIFRFSFLMSYT